MRFLPTTQHTRAGAGRVVALGAVVLLTGPVAVHTQAPPTLDIYWIDVEGGAATLVVTPERASVLMDTGWPRPDARDAGRIEAAMRDAGITEIDYLLISHFHPDHVGGLAALAERVPIGQIVDHGDSVERDRERGRQTWANYLAVADGRRRTVEPGDKLPLRRLEFSFVASHGAFIDTLEPGLPNRLCETAAAGRIDQSENSKSLGYLVSFGAFQFLNLGDLTPNHEYDLACPENRLGVVDLAISEFPKGRKYLISLSFRGKASVRPAQVGGFDVNIVIHGSTAVRGRGDLVAYRWALWKLTAPWTHRTRPPHLGKRCAFPTSFHRAFPIKSFTKNPERPQNSVGKPG